MARLVPKGPPATVADWLAQPEDARLELIDGELIEKAMPTFEHGRAQGHTVGALGGPFDRRAGGSGGPGAGGWPPRSTSCWTDAVTGLTSSAGDAIGCRRPQGAAGRDPTRLAVRDRQ
jgi:hypothetical protein